MLTTLSHLARLGYYEAIGQAEGIFLRLGKLLQSPSPQVRARACNLVGNMFR